MKKRLTIFTLVTLLIISMLSLTSCKGDENGNTDAEADVIKLGVIAPLTGEISQYGIGVNNAAKLAAEEINDAGGIDGKMIEIISYDSKADKTEAINAYNKLRDQDNITALIGCTISGTTLSIKEIAAGDGIPVLTPTATNLDVTLNAPNIFRACFTDPYQGETAAVFSAEDLGAKKAAVIYNLESAYSEGIAEAFKTKYSDLGEITNFEGYADTDTDFRTILTKIADKKPDVLFIPDYYAKVGVILTQVKELGIDVVCIGVDGWDGIEADYADVAEGHYFINHYSKNDPSELVQNFITKFEETYDMSPNALAALGYDATKIMSEAIKNAGSTESSAIVEELSNISTDGVTGHITFDENGDPTKSISVIQIVNGEHKLAGKVSVE